MISWPSCQTDSPSTTLRKLTSEFPLSASWQAPEIYCDTSCVSGVRIHVVGLCCDSRDGDCVTGSAASQQGADVVRAYFELLERAAVLDAIRRPGGLHDVRDASGVWCERLPARELFPESPRPELWRYARSNGVALGASAADACVRAEWELVERDRVLRSWHGESRPIRMPLSAAALPPPLFEVYDFESYVFPATSAPSCAREIAVAGVFGFPKQAHAPLIFGFAGRAAGADALHGAGRECVQRLGFLWGESIPDKDPPFAPTAEFHQEYFLWPGQHETLRRWLAHGRPRCAPTPPNAGPRARATRHFADLTPTALRGKLAIMKALPTGELPLFFGRSERPNRSDPRCDFHPIP